MAFSLNNSNSLFCITTPIAGYPFSLMGWFRVPDVSLQLSLMGLVSFSSGSRCDVKFAGNTTDSATATAESVDSGTAVTTSPMIPGTWHHLLAVFASDTKRTIYLDGGNAGVNTDLVSVSALDFFYFGNIADTNLVDIAEVAIVQAEISAEQAAGFVKRVPVFATPYAADVVAYQDCIRQLNRPALGPTFTSNGTLNVIEHPPIHIASRGRIGLSPSRLPGPWYLENAEASSSSLDIGQLAMAGMAVNNTTLAGEVRA